MEGSQLVSIALVSEDGLHHFYAEMAPLPLSATAFVRETVYPLLEGGHHAISDLEMTDRLRRFLSSVPRPHVLYDYENDRALLLRALGGFSRLPSELAECADPPKDLQSSLIQDDRLQAALESYFVEHPHEASRRHHALVDATALRAAWTMIGG